MWNMVKCKPSSLALKMFSWSLEHRYMKFSLSTAVYDHLFQYRLLCLLESYLSVPLYAVYLSVKTNGIYWKTLVGWMNQ